MEIALAREVPDKQANNFRNSPANGGIHFVKPPHLPKGAEPKKPCFRCGKDHIPQICRFKDELCRSSKSKGHIAKVCNKQAPTSLGVHTNGSCFGQNWGRQSARYVGNDASPQELEDDFKLYQIHQENPESFNMVPIKVNGEEFSMELDTGVSFSIMSEEAWKKKLSKIPLEESQMKLRTYTGEALEIVGQAQVNVTYQDQAIKLPIQVVRGGEPGLLGRNWLKNINSFFCFPNREKATPKSAIAKIFFFFSKNI